MTKDKLTGLELHQEDWTLASLDSGLHLCIWKRHPHAKSTVSSHHEPGSDRKGSSLVKPSNHVQERGETRRRKEGRAQFLRPGR